MLALAPPTSMASPPVPRDLPVDGAAAHAVAGLEHNDVESGRDRGLVAAAVGVKIPNALFRAAQVATRTPPSSVPDVTQRAPRRGATTQRTTKRKDRHHAHALRPS